MAVRQRVTDRGSPRKYWTQVPNLVDDSDLDPFGRALLMHYLRIAGQRDVCDETVRETATHCRMSPGMVLKARATLEEGGWIQIEELGTHGRGSWQRIHILDRWPENMLHYEKADGEPVEGNVHAVNNSTAEEADCSLHEQNVHGMNNSEGNVHAMNELCHHVNNSISPSFLTGEELKKGDEKSEKRACARDGPLNGADFQTNGHTKPVADVACSNGCGRMTFSQPPWSGLCGTCRRTHVEAPSRIEETVT